MGTNNLNLGVKVAPKFVLCRGFWSNVHLVGDIIDYFDILVFVFVNGPNC